MKKNFSLYLFLPVAFLLISACVPAGQPPQAELTEAAPPIAPNIPNAIAAPQNSCPEVESGVYGLWGIKIGEQNNTLAISSRSVYLVESDNQSGTEYVRESFYEVKEKDLATGTFKLRLKWVRVNGLYGGFDSPSKIMVINIDGDVLQYIIMDEGMEPAEGRQSGLWTRQ